MYYAYDTLSIDALAGGRFYATNSDPHTDHDASVRTVSMYDTDTMLDEGYFHLAVSQRWGLQYEIVWLYEATTDDPEGPKSGGAGPASPDPEDSPCTTATTPGCWCRPRWCC